MKLLFNILLFLLPFSLAAQYHESFYPSGQLQERGNYKSYKVKSTYGHDIAKIKNGKWEYFYETGDIALIEFHKARKSGAKAKGTWEYYGTNGELLKKEHYSNGNLSKTEFFAGGTFNFLTDSFTLTQISPDSMRLVNYMHGTPFRQIVVNNGKGVFVYPKAAPNSDKYEIAALADDGFRLKDTGLNIIGNFSFENSKFKKYYDDKESEITGVADTFAYHWYIATGTPDYFRYQESARTGDKFMGIRIYSNSEYLEYIENQFKDTLQKGHKYCTRVFFRLNPASGMGTDAIGFKFDNRLLKFYYRAEVLPLPDIINKPGQLLTEKNRWMQLTGLYTAKGGERYLTIGGFRGLGAQNAKVLSAGRKQEAYYLIDDVYVWEIADESECFCNTITVPDSLKTQQKQEVRRKDTTTYEVGKTFVIKNIFFDIDKSELLPKSFEALDSLVELLYLYPAMEIEISGHTDNTGTDERNRELSQERAKAVADYLISYGIMPERLTYAGYAADRPIDTNATPEGRQNNRRVEFKIIKM